MAPTPIELEAALVDAVAEIYHSAERDQLSVNLARKRAESKLGLRDGFFKEDAWKDKSKQIVRDAVENIETAAPEAPQFSPAKKQQSQSKNGTKRASPDISATPLTKRRKVGRPSSKSEPEDRGHESASDAQDVAPRGKPKPRRRAKRTEKKHRKVVDSDSEDQASQESDASEEEDSAPDSSSHQDTPGPKKARRQGAPKKSGSAAPESDSSLSDREGDVQASGPDKPDREAAKDESSESEVFDEPPRRKRKSKEPAPKGHAKSGKRGAKTSSNLSPDEAEIKKLQGQLVKCGVRKIWAFELKQYGDDSRAKIRHLRNMLKDVGMEGRFSEAKARMIKERRELEADLQEVQEMNKNWGLSGGRSSRGRPSRPLKLPSDLESDEEDEDEEEERKDKSGSSGGRSGEEDQDDSEEEDRPRAKARGSAKYRADMAFLGDQSESD